MDLKSWLDAERGRYTELAEHLDVTVSRVSQMADDGVPPKYMLQVRDFSSGAVTLEEMVRARTPEPDTKSANAPARTSDKPKASETKAGRRSTDKKAA